MADEVIIRNHPDRVCYVPIDNIRQGVDVDTPEGYEKVKGGDWVE